EILMSEKIVLQLGRWVRATRNPMRRSAQRRLVLEQLEARELLSATNLVDASVPATTGNFDFGTRSSPVGVGDTQVTPATVYSPGQGYGWSAGSIFAMDRGGADPVNRDFNVTTDGTFVVDVVNGTYSVAVTLGDLGPYAHDQVGVFLQGTQV